MSEARGAVSSPDERDRAPALTSAGDSGPRPLESRARDALFDNGRALLILLVAVGHAMEPLIPRVPFATALYEAFYLFHIPAFAALSGYLSKPTVQWRSLFWSLALPLVIFQALYVAFDVYVLGHRFTSSAFTTPYWLLWFLLSLLWWRLMLPVLLWTRVPMLLSIALCLGAGAFPEIGYPFSLSRTFVFLPCFMAGHLLRREYASADASTGASLAFIVKLRGWLRDRIVGTRGRSRASVVVAAAVFIALVVLIGLTTARVLPVIDSRWLYGSNPFSGLHASVTSGLAHRAGLLVVALVLTAAFFVLMPRRDTLLTGYGARSLAPYLLHGFVVRGLGQAGAFGPLQSTVGAVVAIIGALVVALVLGLEPIARLTVLLWNPGSLLRKKPVPAKADSALGNR